jgi:predicted nuclease of predicted toxin-antitoxin system
MSLFDESTDWFEIEEALWLDSHSQPKKLKLCADANVPREIIAELRRAGIPVVAASEEGLAKRSDEEILAWTKRIGRVLLTLDRDFWDDRKFPLRKSPGIIFIDVKSEKSDDILHAFGLLYGTFASSYSLDWWDEMKVRAKREGYVLRMRSREGRGVEYAIKLVGKQLYARELSGIAEEVN